MVISHFSFVGFDHQLLTWIFCAIFAAASVIVWIWNKKPPLSIFFGIAALGVAAFVRPPDSLVNLGVVVFMALGAWLESRFLHTSRGFLWVFAFFVWTAGSLIYDFSAPHSVRLREDNLIEQKGDRVLILQRSKLRVVHITRQIKQLQVGLQYWSIENGDQAIQLFDDELYTDLKGRLYTGAGVAKTIAAWAHGRPIELVSQPESLDLKPWH